MSVLAAGLLAASTLTLVPAEPTQADEISASDRKGLIKEIREYFSYLQEDSPGKAYKQLDEIEKKIGDIAKKEKFDAPLAKTELWREVLRESAMADKATVRVGANSKWGNRPLELDSPIPSGADSPKKHAKIFDGKLKVWQSAPKDAKKRPYPVIVALHPQPDEPSDGSVKEMTSSKEMVETVETWLEETYPPEVLAEAIILAPIMDLIQTESDGATGTRPRWDSQLGAVWIFGALRDIALTNLHVDTSRIFLDGHGNGAAAAVQFCSQYPGLQSGAIVRGKTPDRIQAINLRTSPLLFIGSDAKGFHDQFAEEDGYQFSYMDAPDGDGLVQWIQGHSKTYTPPRVEIKANSLAHTTAYWVQITDFDQTMSDKVDAHLVAEFDRDKNEITITTNEKVKALVLYLNDTMVDLDSKVKVIHQLLPSDPDADPVEPQVRYEGLPSRGLEDTLQLSFFCAHSNVGEVFSTRLQVFL